MTPNFKAAGPFDPVSMPVGKKGDVEGYRRYKEHHLERGSSVVECRTRNHVSPGSNPPLLPFGRLGIFLLSIDAPVD